MKTTRSIIFSQLAKAIAPDPEILPSTWASNNLVVADGPYQGEKWKLELTPYLAEILDCMSPSKPYRRVSVKKSAQLGLTGVGLAWLGYIIDVVPASTLVVFPTILSSKNFNKEKLAETLSKTPALKNKVVDQTNKGSNGSSGLFKRFPGGFAVLTGANSSVDLRSKTIKNVLADEIDDWPLDLDGQGDPMSMVDARMSAFDRTGDAKKLEFSTPTFKGMSRIDEAFESGDQRYFMLPCPHCGFTQRLVFENLKFENQYPYNAHYMCSDCGSLIEHHQKDEMLAKGEWVAHNPGPGKHPSFSINALYSPLTTWDDIAKKWWDAQDDQQKLKAFRNLVLGESFEVDGEAPEAERLFNRRADYHKGSIPAGGLFLTAGVDVQADRLEIEVVAWGIGKTSWSIDKIVLEGDTAELFVWGELNKVLNRTYYDWQNNPRQIESMAIDSGYRPQMVYSFTKGKHKCFAIKGVGSAHAPILGTPSKQDTTRRDGERHNKKKRKVGGVMLWPVGTWQLKAELYALLNMDGPSESGGFPPGWCHFPQDYDLLYFQQLTSERLVEREQKGYLIREWVKDSRVRNENLDCRVYAMAAAYSLGMGQWQSSHWERLASERNAPPAQEQLDLLKGMESPIVVNPTTATKVVKSVPEPDNSSSVWMGGGYWRR